MRRPSRPLDPGVAADLAALDAALAGARPDPDVALIAAEARAWAPPMTPAFAAALDDAVTHGFARRAPAAAPAPRRPVWWRIAPAFGLAAAVLIALVVVSSPTGGGDAQDSSSSAGGGTAAPAISGGGATAPRSAAKSDESAQLAAPAGSALAPPGAGPRRIERAAELTITTPASRLESTADRVVGVVDRLGGYVERSDVSRAGTGGEATFELRIPTSRLDSAVAALSRLGHVQSRSQHAQDITAPFESAAARLREARAERKALLRALARADTVQETDSIRARLRIVRSEIAAAKGDLAAVRRRADYARVTVMVLGRGDAAVGGRPNDRWTPGDALRDAVHVLGAAAGIAIVAAAILLPAALLGLLGVLVGRSVRRRRRESALDHGAAAV